MTNPGYTLNVETTGFAEILMVQEKDITRLRLINRNDGVAIYWRWKAEAGVVWGQVCLHVYQLSKWTCQATFYIFRSRLKI